MKQTLKFASVAILLCLFVSCSEQDENINPEVSLKGKDVGIERKWSLTHFGKGLAGVDIYEAGDIIWRFDSQKKLTVEINVDISGAIVPIFKEGKYPFDVKSGKVVLNNVEYDYMISDDELTISDHPEVDGPYLTFKSVK
ncbi:hypothetical protein KK083_07195 [Fulvivirgaceae bacterium PWU4]|uniref:Lipoprotein n=1 Tax=Chryseosolibacter histidini TaxID=2782349 RepID=A0AAP2GNL8_9BACT|nr:hypothetical protein [Chryseosolibacter histidini]MBT1696652.1 hypothetical protein [Chryseosolibacter histidini]